MEKPKWDPGSSLWGCSTFEVGAYIITLEEEILELKERLCRLEREISLVELWTKGDQENY